MPDENSGNGSAPQVYQDLIEAFYRFTCSTEDANKRIQQFWDGYEERHRDLQGVWIVDTEGVTTRT